MSTANTRPHGPARRFLAAALLVVASFLVVALLLELGLRVVGWHRQFQSVEPVTPGTPRPLGAVTLHANRVIRHRSNEFDVTYTTNSRGYFDREWNPSKPEGTYRLAFLGDSFTMGHGVDLGRAFPQLLEACIDSNETVEVLNFGVWGTGTAAQLEFLPDVEAMGVDGVVFCFYLNDIFDNKQYVDALGAHGPAPDTPLAAEPPASFKDRLKDVLDTSRAAAFVLERTKYLRDALGLVTYPLAGVFTGLEDDGIDQCARYFSDAAADLARRGIECTVVYVPALVQVQGAKVPESFDLDLPQRRLLAGLRGVHWIDLTGPFRDVEASNLWMREGHWTPEGHQLVAAWLCERLSVPQ